MALSLADVYAENDRAETITLAPDAWQNVTGNPNHGELHVSAMLGEAVIQYDEHSGRESYFFEIATGESFEDFKGRCEAKFFERAQEDDQDGWE
jgi:hypothetical protein